MIITLKDGRWNTQIIKRLGWYLGYKRHDYAPIGAVAPPAWAIPLDGWITDPKEIERTVRENGLEL